MKNSPRRGIDVFNYDEDDDDVTDSLAGKHSGKLRSPSPKDDALSARDFVECVFPGTAVQKSEIANVPCVHVDAVDCNPSCDKATLRSALDKAENKIVSMNECNEERPSSHEEHLELRLLDKAENKIVSMNECNEERPSSHEEHLELRLDNEGSRNFVSEAEKTLVELKASPPMKFELNCDRLDSSSESEHIDVTSGVDESVTRSSSSSPASGMAEDDDLSNDCALDHCSGDMEMDDMNMTVVLYPDYITYRDNYYTGPRVIFSDSCIKIMGSTAYGNQEAFDFEWGCDDVVNIVSQMFQKVETVMIKLRVLSKDENVHQHTGIDEVNIFVVEPNWCEKLEEITSLNQRYFTVWDHADDSDMGTGIDGDDSPRVRRYFPVFEESFEDVIYPKGEADAVSISKRDVDLLQPETFVNDTIIDFYIKYLKNQIQPEERHKFHFFNSFFFRKLADLDKDPSSASDGAAAFQRVRKWTRKVDLFGKEFVFVPINFSLHWSLIVICHPGEAAAFTDENLDKSLKVPCILHMDSIKGNHAGLKHLIQSYLFEEWKERKKETSEEVSSRFHNLRFVSLELPQQENSFDCGLFLLHYLERFLAEVPDNFNPFKIEKPSTFLYSNWFPPTEASLKRALIQRLISELLKNHSKGVSTSASSDDDQIMESNVNGVGGNFLSARFDPGPSCKQTTLPSSEVGRGIELTLLSASSIKSSQCINDSDLVLRDLFNPGASLMGQCQSYDQKPSDYGLNGDISPLEEAPETGEQIMFGENEFDRPQLTGNTQSGSIPYPSKEYGGETLGVGISLQAENRGINCSREPSIGISDDEPDIAITEAFSVAEYSSPSQKERTDEPRSSSVEHVEFIKGLVSASHDLPDTSAAAEAFQNCEMVQSGNENESGVPSFFENQDVLVSQDAVMSDDDVHMIEDDGMVDSKTSGQKPLDNSIGSGDNVQNAEDGLVSLDAPEPLPIGSGGNIVEVGLVGLASLGLELVDNGTGSGDNAQVQAPGQQPVHNGTGSNDNTRMVADDPVLLDSPIQQSVGITTCLEIVTASVDNIEIVVEDGSAGLGSSEQKPVDDVTASVDNSQIFEDASVGLDSPEQQPVDDATGSGDDSHIYEDALMGPDSPGQKRVENVVGLGDNSLVFEDASAYSGSPHNVQIAECSLLAPNSLCQQSADNGSGSSNDVQTKDDEFVTPENGIGSGDDFKMKEDEFVAPENGTGSGDDMQMKDNEFVAPENRTGSDDNALMNEDGSHEHQHEKIGLGDNMQIVEDIDLAVRDSSQLQPGQIVIDSGYVPIVKHNSVAPDSPRQHPAKRPRLSPSVEDETGAVKSLTEN